MNKPENEPTTSPILRMGVALLFLCCAALAIAYAWFEFERVENLKSKVDDASGEKSVIDSNGSKESREP